jgi:hypothetical protein
VQRIIAFLKQQDHLCWMAAWSEEHILQQAEASTQRYQQGSPLSLLDGVPFAVKDLLDALPYPTAGGTAFMADRCAAAWTDATLMVGVWVVLIAQLAASCAISEQQPCISCLDASTQHAACLQYTIKLPPKSPTSCCSNVAATPPCPATAALAGAPCSATPPTWPP